MEFYYYCSVNVLCNSLYNLRRLQLKYIQYTTPYIIVKTLLNQSSKNISALLHYFINILLN